MTTLDRFYKIREDFRKGAELKKMLLVRIYRVLTYNHKLINNKSKQTSTNMIKIFFAYKEIAKYFK